jgi:hypothetical protein
MEDDLEHWEWIRDQRTEDLALEMERDADPQLIKLLSDELDKALKMINELSK